MISVRGLAHRYGSTEVLRLPEWKVAQGERWLVLGPSGCGKTTLLHVIAGLIRPTEGEVEVSGESLRKLDGARLEAGYFLGALGYASGLALSTLSDLPAGPLTVCTITALGIGLFLIARPRVPI